MYNNVLRKTSPPPSHPIRQRNCESMYDELQGKHAHLGKRLTQIPSMDFLELTRPVHVHVPIYYIPGNQNKYPSAFDLMEKDQLEKIKTETQTQEQEPSQEQEQEQEPQIPNRIIEEKVCKPESQENSVVQQSDEVKLIIGKRLVHIIASPNEFTIFKRKDLIGYQISKSNLHIFLKKNTITINLPDPTSLKKVVNAIDKLLEKNATCMMSCWFVC